MSPRKSRRRRPLKRKSNKKKIILAVALLAAVAVIIVVASMISNTEPEQPEPDVPSGSDSSSMKVRLTTTMGDIVIELRDDMPITTGNFKNLVQEGVYDDTIFHRVIDGFMIQGGDPTGTGYGDPSIPTIPDEFTDNNRNDRGTVAMANRGPNTGSSQFFINLEDNNNLPSDLNSNHPVFGRVIEGMGVVDQIGKVAVDEANNHRPLEDVRIYVAEIID